MANETSKKKVIQNLAERAACELLEANPTLKDKDQKSKRLIIYRALRDPKSNAAKLKDGFCSDRSFEIFRRGWIQCSSMGRRMEDHVIPQFLILSVINGFSAKSLVDEILAFADCRSSVTETYAPLAGATIDEAVSLGVGIDLVPWTDVPKSIHWADEPESIKMTHINPNWYSHKLIPFRQTFPQMEATKNSAIRIRVKERNVFFTSSTEAKTEYENLSKEFTNHISQIEDVVRCITALSGQPVAALGYWTQFNSSLANEMIGSSFSHFEASIDNSAHTMFTKPIALEGQSIAELYNRFVDFNSSEKNVMRISLDRLCKVLRGGTLVDKAIDLGIALEVLLLHKKPKDNIQGELAYRSSIRGATFLGGNKSERMETFKNLNNAYKLRSKAVHSGDLPIKNKNESTQKTLHKATNICADLARKLIEMGSFPNWEDDFVVGGQDSSGEN